MPLKFSQPGVSCADNTLAAIAASFDVQHQWRNCHGPENYLEVDFGVTLFLAMIKVASHPLYYADEFNIRYAVNYTIWHNISNVDGGEFVSIATRLYYIKIVIVYVKLAFWLIIESKIFQNYSFFSYAHPTN